MIVPAGLLVVSLAALIAAFAVPGWADLVILAAPCTLAAAFLLFRQFLAQPREFLGQPRARAARPRTPPPPPLVIDGSNVMHWRDNVADIAVVREVVVTLTSRGYAPGVAFDANAGYLISGRYMNERDLGAILGLPVNRILVVGKGTPADPVILSAARELSARIVTNDRYRDWAADHPEVATPGHLIRGGYRDGALWLDLDGPGDAAPATRPAPVQAS